MIFLEMSKPDISFLNPPSDCHCTRLAEQMAALDVGCLKSLKMNEPFEMTNSIEEYSTTIEPRFRIPNFSCCCCFFQKDADKNKSSFFKNVSEQERV